jgi:hypothetical protein
MKPSAHTPRGPPTSGTIPARLLHTLFVFSATSLMLIIAILSFLLTFLMKFIMPAPSPAAHRRRGVERHVTFLEQSTVITLPAMPRAPARANIPTPASTATTTLSLTTAPHELEPPTPDAAEDPLRALSRTCGFLAANTARGLKREELSATPPLAGLEPYLAAVRKDLARIEEMGEEDESESESESEEGDGEGDSHGDAVEVKEGAVVAVTGEVRVGDRQDVGAGADADEGSEAGKGDAAAAGAGTGASADAHDEPGLVPDQATRASPPPLPPTQLPTQSLSPEPSATVTTTPMPPTPPTPPEPTVKNAASPDQTDTTPIPSTSTNTSTNTSMTRRPPAPPPPPATTATKRPPPPLPPITTTTTTPTTMPNPGPRKRKDAVLRPTRPTTILGPGGLVLSATGVAGVAGATTTTTTVGDAPANANANANDTNPPCDAADADKLADSDDAAVRAAALFSRVADLGAGLFEGTVRERGAALWTALSRGRGAPSDVPVPQIPRTRFATGAASRG